MAGQFTGNTRVVIDGLYRDTSPDLVTPSTKTSFQKAVTWSSSPSLPMYSDTFTLAATTSTINLFGSLTDVYGGTLNFATIRQIVIVNKGAVGEDLLLSGTFPRLSLLNSWVDDLVTIVVRGGGTYYNAAPLDGYTVTDTTQETITFDSGAATFDVDLFLWGT